MSAVSEALVEYLQLRRGLGHNLADAGRQLDRFVAYLDAAGAEVVTTETVIGFVFAPGVDPAGTNPAHRLGAVRGFARYLAARDPRHEIPPADLVSYRPRTHVPYLYSEADLAAMIGAARACSPFPFRGHTLATMIGLLAITGMRVSEAIHLDRADVDWDDAVLQVRDSKFRKGRDVPVATSTIDALAGYRAARDRRPAMTDRLFISLRGTPIIYANFQVAFRQIVTAAGVGAGRVPAPRVHDLRHRFATLTLLGWHRDGLDAEALLPRLSTYLGHSDPRFTYRYLTATPELLAYAAARLEHATGTRS